MSEKKNETVVLEENDLLNGMEVFIIIEGLKLFNEKHKEDIKSLEAKGKNPFLGEKYFETLINHGLIWKLKKLSDKQAESMELKNGKL